MLRLLFMLALLAPNLAAADTVSFPSHDEMLTGGGRTVLPAFLFKPEGAGPFPLVVASHSCAGLFQQQARNLNGHLAGWSQRFVAEGWAVVLPDSFTPRGLRRVCEGGGEKARPGRERAADIWGAVAWAQTQTFLRPDRMAMIGWSHGGATVLFTNGARSPQRPAKVAHEFREVIAFYPSCAAVAATPFDIAAPLAIFTGADDDWTPAAPCRALAQRLPQIRYTEYPGAWHGFDTKGVPRTVLQGVNTPSRTATIGSNDAAREASVAATLDLLRAALRD